MVETDSLLKKSMERDGIDYSRREVVRRDESGRQAAGGMGEWW